MVSPSSESEVASLCSRVPIQGARPSHGKSPPDRKPGRQARRPFLLERKFIAHQEHAHGRRRLFAIDSYGLGRETGLLLKIQGGNPSRSEPERGVASRGPEPVHRDSRLGRVRRIRGHASLRTPLIPRPSFFLRRNDRTGLGPVLRQNVQPVTAVLQWVKVRSRCPPPGAV